jgi:hypothetical protein
MSWWGWLLVLWAGIAVVGAVWAAAALRIAERRERLRRQIDEAVSDALPMEPHEQAG